MDEREIAHLRRRQRTAAELPGGFAFAQTVRWRG
jgi:hypothetical protein